MKRSRLSPRSARRISEADHRRQVVDEVVARDGYVCHAIGVIPGHRCAYLADRQGLEAHEIIPRSAWPAGHLVASNVILVCPTAHLWIDANPDKAEELGLHGKSWMRPDGHCGQGPAA